MNKSPVTSQELIDDASAYFINLKNTGAWKIEISRNSQIIALTTQLTELKTEFAASKASKGTPKLDTPKLDDGKHTGGPAKYVFELWCLEKIDNKVEHNMVERDGKIWYWCDKHRYNNKSVVTNDTYATHKPDGHETWTERRSKGRKGGAMASIGNDPAHKPTTTPSVSNDSSASKLSLSKSLQAALVTTASITED